MTGGFRGWTTAELPVVEGETEYDASTGAVLSDNVEVLAEKANEAVKTVSQPQVGGGADLLVVVVAGIYEVKLLPLQQQGGARVNFQHHPSCQHLSTAACFTAGLGSAFGIHTSVEYAVHYKVHLHHQFFPQTVPTTPRLPLGKLVPSQLTTVLDRTALRPACRLPCRWLEAAPSASTPRCTSIKHWSSSVS
jgi:hypothetical protein